MIQRLKIFLVITAVIAVLVGFAVVIRMIGVAVSRNPPAIVLEGSVLAQSPDPNDRIPLAGVTVTAVAGTTSVKVQSDPSGFFQLSLNSDYRRGQEVDLTFQKANFKNLEIKTSSPGDQLYLAQMEPLGVKPKAGSTKSRQVAKTIVISSVRVRYSFKEVLTASVGSFVKRFTVENKGNVPCNGHKPCSPDGRWKASVTTLPIDAEPGNEFSNVRVSCLAGPCHFTKMLTALPEHPANRIEVSVLNWSDTASFLVEADVIRNMSNDSVRISYPFILGNTMSFTMPPGSEGPSIEADLDGSPIVFPLGPDLLLAWASCSQDASQDGTRVFRCQLKGGYRFQ